VDDVTCRISYVDVQMLFPFLIWPVLRVDHSILDLATRLSQITILLIVFNPVASYWAYGWLPQALHLTPITFRFTHMTSASVLIS
jgi:hypothetical protein